MQAAKQPGHAPLLHTGYESLPVRTDRLSGRVERAGRATPQSGRDAVFSVRAPSVIGVTIQPFKFVAVVYCAADAAYAQAIAARLADVANVMPILVTPTSAMALGPRVAAVVIWSSAAAHEGVSEELARYAAPDRAVLTLVRDGAPPSSLRALSMVQASSGDAIVDAGVMRDALLTWNSSLKVVAGEAAPAAVATRRVEDISVNGFARGLAASIAAMSLAGVGGYVLVPAVAAQDAAPALPPTPIMAKAVAENSFAAQPAVAVQYSADPYVSARFGGELRVAFAAQPAVSAQVMADVPVEAVAVAMADASLPAAPVLRGVYPAADATLTQVSSTDSAPTAALLTAVDSVSAATPVFTGPATISSIDADTAMTVFGAATGGPLGIAPSYITDTPADEPQIY